MNEPNRRPKLSLFGSKHEKTTEPEVRVARRETVHRSCACGCGDVHSCRETFREMVERCARTRDGSIIMEGGQ